MNQSGKRSVKISFSSRGVETVSVMLLFLAFACCALTLVLTGAQVYRTINDSSAANHELRSPTAYIVNRLRAADDASTVIELKKDGEGSRITIREQTGGGEYSTHIYVYDGFLRELFIDSGFTFDPGDGESIAAIGALDCEYSDGMLTLRITAPGGGSFTASTALRAAAVREEAAK